MARRKNFIKSVDSGNAFENLLEFVNRQYANQGIALIHKRPTPIDVITSSGSQILKSAFAKKSTVDYDGVYRSRAIYFEAKNTMESSRFPLSNIKPHQIEHLQQARKHDAICFLLVSFMKLNKVFYVPLEFIESCMERADQGGRKSITYAEFKEHCYEVIGTRRAALDYLIHVDREIGETA